MVGLSRQNMKTTFIYLKMFFLIVLSVWVTACAPKTILVSRSRLMMGHVPVNIILKTSLREKKRAIEATETAYQVAEKIEKIISEYQPESDISCLNQNAGKRFCILSKETDEILKQSMDINRKTDSAFDIRFASLSQAGREAAILIRPLRLSSKNQGKFIEKQIGKGEKKTLKMEAKLSHPETRIGVSAIGKGFILNAMIESLKKEGFDQSLIDGGGDIQASGGPWKVAIQIPSGKPGQNSSNFKIVNQALATSGNYEQAGNVRNPKTLQKIVRSSSVSVIAPTLTLANALTTAFYVMGEEESILYLGKFPGIKIYWTDPSGKIRVYPSEKK